jgi:hypothetical protein
VGLLPTSRRRSRAARRPVAVQDRSPVDGSGLQSAPILVRELAGIRASRPIGAGHAIDRARGPRSAWARSRGGGRSREHGNRDAARATPGREIRGGVPRGPAGEITRVAVEIAGGSASPTVRPRVVDASGTIGRSRSVGGCVADDGTVGSRSARGSPVWRRSGGRCAARRRRRGRIARPCRGRGTGTRGRRGRAGRTRGAPRNSPASGGSAAGARRGGARDRPASAASTRGPSRRSAGREPSAA